MNTRLNKIRFKAGPDGDQAPLHLQTGTVTVLVGPNNSGKSLALLEVEKALHSQPGEDLSLQNVVSDVDLRIPPAHERWDQLLAWGARLIAPKQFKLLAANWESPIVASMAATEHDGIARGIFGRAIAARLDGTSRLSLLNEAHASDLQQPAPNPVVWLFQNGLARRQLSDLALEAFQKHLVIDPTGMSRFRARLSDRAPTDENEEQSLSTCSRSFHASAKPLSEFSDGVRCYLSILTAALNDRNFLLLIDEPEAFLHPPLARRLGYHLGRIARERTKQVVLATHSSHIVMGLVDSGVDMSVVRLTFDGREGHATHLPTETMRQFSTDPLLRSSNVLEALFHDAVVATEGDADRAFYEEVNRRLLESPARDGIASCLFLNAQGKDGIPKLLGPLRELGLKVAAIADIDVLLDGGQNWSAPLAAAGVPQGTMLGLGSMRAKITETVKAIDQSRPEGANASKGRTRLKSEGLGLLSPELQETARDLMGILEKYGYFVVRVGELEGWLADQGIKGHGPKWLIPMFERMGSDPSSPDYLKPESKDVWQFMRRIAVWMRDAG